MRKFQILLTLFIVLIVHDSKAQEVALDSFNARVEAGEEPEASSWGFMFSALCAVDYYTEWSDVWKQSNRNISANDQTINQLMSGYMLGVSKYLSRNKDPKLLEFYLTFIGKQVPEEFDDIWNVVLVEFPGINNETGRSVDAMLKNEGFTPLAERAKSKYTPRR